ncbi:unnamed protein product [Protopolystoma xenopodis]|uniref:Uncharacterized protein n=1 Tax=Protopolystoma xenopodis TaxID=117903 RepID=A0A3S5AZY9_9PLAT|nr:unnamed protein product [Protopolystoma xenopodis]
MGFIRAQLVLSRSSVTADQPLLAAPPRMAHDDTGPTQAPGRLGMAVHTQARFTFDQKDGDFLLSKGAQVPLA